jgi:hypothetical protein
MRRKFRKSLKRALIAFAYLALTCKLLIPVGFMPAPIGAGGPIALCPGAVTLPVFLQHGGDHDGQPNPQGKHKWDHCPYGTLAKSMSLPAAWDYSGIGRLNAPEIPAFADPIPSLGAPKPFRARAPPGAPA